MHLAEQCGLLPHGQAALNLDERNKMNKYENSIEKGKYPEGLGPESVVDVLDKPRDQAQAIFRRIIAECRDWPTQEAAELQGEAESMLDEASGKAVEYVISYSLAQGGEATAYYWPSRWICEDLLKLAAHIRLIGDRLEIRGRQNGRPWAVELVDVSDSVQAMARAWLSDQT